MSQSAPTGFSIPLSAPRRLINDLVHFARQVPTVPVQRTMDVSRVAALRDRAARRVGWAAIFTKAYAQVCSDFPALRRAYLEYPRPRLYQHPFPVASMAVERDYEGEPGVFFTHIKRPETVPLAALDATVRRAKTAPVEETFAFQLWFAGLPRPARRFVWWWVLNCRGSRKAEFLGTFGVTVYSGLGSESLHPLTPLTTTLNYGVIGPDGSVPVRVVYDHRVMDGSTAARALARLQDELAGPVADELADLGRAAEPAHANGTPASAA
jgi:hypothetical protein